MSHKMNFSNQHLGDYNFCRSTHAEERPFCVNSRDQKIECLKIKECPGLGFVTWVSCTITLYHDELVKTGYTVL